MYTIRLFRAEATHQLFSKERVRSIGQGPRNESAVFPFFPLFTHPMGQEGPSLQFLEQLSSHLPLLVSSRLASDQPGAHSTSSSRHSDVDSYIPGIFRR